MSEQLAKFVVERLVEGGVCRFCGCVDERACEGGCWWITEDRTVCSARPCVDAYFAEQAQSFGQLAKAFQDAIRMTPAQMQGPGPERAGGGNS